MATEKDDDEYHVYDPSNSSWVSMSLPAMTNTEDEGDNDGSDNDGSDNNGNTECMFCTEHATEFVVLPCNHLWCRGCLKYPFAMAYNGGFGRAPRCCGDIEPTPTILSPHGTHRPVPAYCHSCHEFVPEHFVVGGKLATCATCKTFTCVPCGKALHAGDCAEDADMNTTLALGKKKGWKQCPNCKTLIEHVQGCHEISCHCGHSFCFICGKQYEDCTCHVFEGPGRLQDEAYTLLEDDL
ncbi:hypothetical protein PG994_002913 [Apiospora phragmitis]|uniref:RBR-type E3 ubiquitin transferase n=1 Tax=Apiospora phragmitis TaxID=2905665 RepID=A0ABR1W6K0_9PEZI